ncbi:methyltransferase [Amycolatopsis sp. NPDC058986]|uniref:methyltransferase n=1 Tax=unclassified Amycolatopsis TaxID=2618356 RepID=UPI00367000C7
MRTDFFDVARRFIATGEVLVDSLPAWMTGTAGLLAGPVVVQVTERAAGVPLLDFGWPRRITTAMISVLTATLWVLGWTRFGATLVLLAWCWVCALGLSLALVDLRCRRLPFALTAAFAGGGAAVLFGTAAVDERWTQLAFAYGASAVVLVLALLAQVCAPEHTGGGDTALYGALALYLGWGGWEALLRGLLIASGLTAMVAFVVVMCSRRMNSRFPAGPSLLAGALASMLFA